MFFHYSDYGANCSDLSLKKTIQVLFAAHYESSALPASSPRSDLSEIEGWEKESERNTLDPGGRKSHCRDKAALLVVCGSSAFWELESCQPEGADLSVSVFHLNKHLLKLHGGHLEECDAGALLCWGE